MSTLFSGGGMKSKYWHNELYKLALEMHKYNGRGVKHNLDLLLSQVRARNKERKNSIR
jgi:hemolysin activation/secretion protein